MTSVKSEGELEQIALAMMMMAGGEGATEEEVGVTRVTRSSTSRSSFQNRRRNLREPVSGNCLNKNKTRTDPLNAGEEEEGDYYPGLLVPHLSRPEECATDLVQDKEEVHDEAIICAINPMSIQSSPSPGPDSPADSHSTNSGSGVSANGNKQNGVGNDCVYMSTSRRIFRPEFKQKVLDAFSNDPECVGNQRATARKFGIHRRQVQKWLQQLSTGELQFVKDPSEQTSASENNEQYSNSTTSNIKLGGSRPLQLVRSGKSVSRRSLGNNARGVGGQQQLTRNQRPNGRASDPPPRTRTSNRNKGKSMPLKGGSKSSHYVPTIVHPSPTSSSKSVLNLTKAASKQNGSNYNAYQDSNGGTNGGSNMFMNMSTLLASAAAAGNLGMPLSLEQPRTFSPRDHSPINYNGRGSPTHSAGGSSGSGSHGSLQNALLLVDELNYLYPYSDFSLLRKALLKEEVSLEKLAHPFIRTKAEFRVNGHGIHDSGSKRSSHSPSPKNSSQQEYNTQQTLDIIRQQQEYYKLLQQCGIGNSGDLASGLNLADLTSNGKLPTWFNPFAAAAAAGLPIPQGINGNGKFANGHGNDNGNGNGRRKETNSDNHRFASPRVPPAVNSSKAKTVAAALAATRVNPQSQQRNFANGRQNQNPKTNQRRKPHPRQTSRNMNQVEDEIDPTSMLEVVTSIPSPTISPRNNTNHYNYSGNNRQKTNGNGDYNQGMDLTTTASSSQNTTTTTTTTTTRLISKAMNKEYSFLNELGLVRKIPEETPKVSNGYGLTHTASLENFVQNILPSRQKSPPAASGSSSSNSPPAVDLNDSDKTKSMVIDAYNYDPNMSGDARAVARKFGLNVRVVMKWLKEGPVKTSPQSNEEYHENGFGNDNNNFARMNGDAHEDEEEAYPQTQNLHKVLLAESNNNSGGSSVNKRKNSKPNQICDFQMEDDAMNGALDMVVPIKKRRVSSPSPTY